MQKWIFLIFLYAVIFVSQFVVQGSAFAEAMEEKAETYTVVVSPQDLVFDHDDIFVNVSGQLYTVHSLMRCNNQWIAELSPHGNCPWGHPLCAHCGLCHKIICPDRQPRSAKCKIVK